VLGWQQGGGRLVVTGLEKAVDSMDVGRDVADGDDPGFNILVDCRAGESHLQRSIRQGLKA